MKQTGSLLRETIEMEALCSKKLDDAANEAALIIQTAEKDAEKISADRKKQIRHYKENAFLAAEQKKEAIRKEYEKKSRTGIDQLKQAFSSIADSLAKETAERIIRYDR
jgi:F0F1-type ATP synthase membrane subunit b/b'